MPLLARPAEPQFARLPPRRAMIAANVDVLVVGGGPAGLAAAMGAADSGASVLLAERYGFLGGNATAALVMPLMSFHTDRQVLESGEGKLFPEDHGPGEPVIGGVLVRLLERLIAARGGVRPSKDTGYVVPFDPEVFKGVALDLLDEAGVTQLLHAFASDALIKDAQLDGVVFETKSGPLVVRARAIVDATGDGDIAARSGAPYDIGRDEDGLVQPMTLMFRVGDFHREAFLAYAREHPDQWRGVYGLWELVRKATEAGELDLPREDILFFATPHPREVSVNSTRIIEALGTEVWDLTRAEWIGRRQMRQIAAFLRKYVPGFEDAYVMQSGVQVGVRETRRIQGEYRLTAADILSARKFDDVIARGTYPVDIHNPAGRGTTLKKLPPGEAYDIPYRCLLPQRTDNLLVAGRCISGTHEAHSSYRVMPIAMATGHAAGIAAAIAARTRKASRELDVAQIQSELLRQGANLGLDRSRNA